MSFQCMAWPCWRPELNWLVTVGLVHWGLESSQVQICNLTIYRISLQSQCLQQDKCNPISSSKDSPKSES